MKAKRKKLTDEQLRDLLNSGDPAGDGSEPTRDEFAAMRRAMLNEARTGPAGSPWLSWSTLTAAATVTVALIALAIFLRVGPSDVTPGPGSGQGLQPGPGPTVQQPPSADAVAEQAGPEEPAEPDEPSPSISPSETTTGPQQPQAAAPAGQVAETVGTEEAQAEDQLAVVPASETPPTDRQARTVRFTAPGGTRIIWTLDPEFQFPVSEPDEAARGEL